MKHSLSDRKHLSSTAWLLLALAAAVALGMLSHLLPDTARSSLSEGLIAPFNDTFMGLLSTIAAPVIFLSILCSICSMGDIKALGKIGRRTISRIVLMPLLLALIILMVMLPFYGISRENGSQADSAALLNLLLDIAPDNLITPFTQGNFLQIIFLAVVLGAALLVLGDKVSSLIKGLQQLRLVINKLMQWITRLMPLFVFGVIFDLMLSNSFHTLISYYKVILICMLAFCVLLILYLIRVSLHKRIPLVLLIKKLFPTFLIALTTASSTVALPTNMKDCEEKLGIDKKLVDFAAPLGQIVFKPGAMTAFWGIALHAASVHEIPITVTWLITAWLMVYLLGASTPPIAGGMILCFNIFFTQLGIPSEALGIAAALNAILTFFCTAVNIACFQCEAVELAGSLDMLDENVLKKSP